MLLQVMLWEVLALVSFAAGGVVVFAIVRVDEYVRRTEPAWWPEFERAFADYVRAGGHRRS